ncbi:unnamed protein product [Meloidogyne enterolobii]|uniref:Uncharacterized protein n=1 Tax=Meloidogyne enterolobii TaxID=390850 RepID=A0ACB0YNV1_MELEN
MHLLQPEVQLDIFKYLNFKQLLNIQQTNRFYKNFINEYEEKLARKKSHGLTADCISCLDYYNLYTPEPKLYDFQISEELEKKWKCGIEESIPMFLYQDNININIIAFEIKESTDLEPG